MNIRFPPLVILLIGLSSSIYYFLQDRDLIAIDVLFLGVYSTLAVYFILKVAFYFRYKATLNELFFYLYINLAIIIVLGLGSITTFSNIAYYTFSIQMSSINEISSDNFQLFITPITMLVMPFLIISSALQLRSFTKYEFIRYTGTSEKGLNAEWLATILFFIFGALFSLSSSLTADFLAFLYGIFYLLLGIGFLLGK